MARTPAAALLLALIAVAGLTGFSNGQILLDVIEGVSEECKENVVGFATDCADDFAAAGEALDFVWPPTEALVVDDEAAAAYFKGLEEVSDTCCAALCLLASSECMCDDGTFDAITKTLFTDDGEFFLNMLKFGGDTCGHKPVSKNLKKTCKKVPKNKC